MARSGVDRRRRLGLTVIDGGKPPTGSTFRCIFCGIEVSDRILLNWHWTASEECGLSAKRAGLV